MGKEDGRERRKHPRITVKGEVLGRIHTALPAPILDLSETGALLEVSSVLRPGSIYALRLTLGPDLVLSLRSRVVRSYVHGFQPRKGGETLVRYRAALEFIETTEADRALLRSHLGGLEGSLDQEF